MQTTGELCITYSIMLYKILLFHFCSIFLVHASQKTHFLTKKMKNEYFVQQKLKLPKSTLLVSPRCTHMHNMGSFEQTMSVVAITSSFDLKGMKLHTR
jgi:hypothetical protein